MSIKGLDVAVNNAIERAKRSKESICVVDIGNDEYVLWRWLTRDGIALVYRHYNIVKVIGYKNDFR